MCGIFGLILYDKTVPTQKAEKWAETLFKLSEARGKDASGLAVLSGNEIREYKEAVRGSKLIETQTFKSLFNKNLTNLPFSFIGHCRLATNGIQINNDNNQPVVNKQGMLVHIGVIANDKELWHRFGSSYKGELDTQVILELICNSLSKGVAIETALSDLYQDIKGSATIAMYHKKYPHLILSTNTGSMYYTFVEKPKMFVFAAEEFILESFLKSDQLSGKIIQLQPYSGLIISHQQKKLRLIDLRSKRKPVRDRDLTVNYKITNVNPENILENDTDKLYSFVNDINQLKKHDFNYKKIYSLQRCSRCILPETMPYLKFNKDMVCNYCTNHKKISYKGVGALEKIFSRYRKSNGKPDCLIAFSGGRDSSYGLHLLKKKLGMNPIAFTYEWGMVTDLARRNQARILGKLGIEHIIVSADIIKKRINIRKNLQAWLKRPNMGLVPLFTVGDKQAEFYVDRIAKRIGIDLVIYFSGCEYENDDFKASYSGVRGGSPGGILHKLSNIGKFRLLWYYLKEFAKNPAYLNSSLLDGATAYLTTYIKPHNYLYLWHYIEWNEDQILSDLRKEYGWETNPNETLTWRTDDGTPAFYNYIYYQVQGFTEIDAFRSGQIREGVLTRNEGLKLANEENKPRYKALKWYFDVLGIDGEKVLDVVDSIPKRY